MNENINKLVYESGLIAQGCWDKFDEYDQQALEKFAQLIAKECADLCDRFQARDVGMQPAECAEAIRKQFGVDQ